MTTILNDTRRADFFARVKELGRIAGAGEKSYPDFAAEMFLAAADQLIVSNVKEIDKDDVRGLVADYFREKAAARADAGLPATSDKAGTIQTKESNFRAFANVGGAPTFRSSRNGGNTIAKDWIALVKARIADQAVRLEEPQPVFDKMCLVCTAQKKKIEKTGDDATPLTIAEIDAAIAPKAKELSELKDLRAIEQKLQKLNKDWPGSSKTVILGMAALAPRMNELLGVEKAKGLKATIESLTPEQLALAGLEVKQPEAEKPAPIEAPTDDEMRSILAAPTLAAAIDATKKPTRRSRKANGLDQLQELVNA